MSLSISKSLSCSPHHLFPFDRLVPDHQRTQASEEAGGYGDEEDDVESFDIGVDDAGLLLERKGVDESDVETDGGRSIGCVEGEVLHKLGAEDGRGDGDTNGSSDELCRGKSSQYRLE